MRRKVFICLFAAIFALSGCGRGDKPPAEAVDNRMNEQIQTGIVETEEPAEAADSAENEGNHEPAENLPKPSAVPVNTRAEDILYYREDDIELERAVRRCKSDGENIYLVYYGPDFYVMPIGADRHSRIGLDNPEGMNVCQIALDAYGGIHLLVTDEDNEVWQIWRLDEDYQIDRVIDISAYYETKWQPGWFLVDEDGTYYLQWPLKWNGIIVDSEGTLKHSFTMQSLGIRGSYEAAIGKNGKAYLVYTNEDRKLEISEFDWDSCSIKREEAPFCFPGDETFSAMGSGTDTNLLLYSPFSGIWACDTESGIMENRVPLTDISSGSSMDSSPLTFLPDGRLLLLEGYGDNCRLKYIPAGR